MQEEIFGPVTCVTVFDTEAEVVERVNNTRWIHILSHPLLNLVFQVRALRQCLVSECRNNSQSGPEAGGWHSLVKLLAHKVFKTKF